MSDDNEQMEMDIGQFAASISVIQNKLIGDFLHDVGHICHKYMNESEDEKSNTNLILIDGDKS